MMDYLAPLVGEEDGGEGLPFPARTVTLPRKGEGAGPEDVGESPAGAVPKGAERERPERSPGGAPWQTGTAPAGGEDFLAALLAGREREEALPPEDSPWQGGWSLEETLARTAQAVQGMSGENRTVTVTLPEAPAAPGTEGDWAALDRAVERDARRYDRGFPLY